MLYAACVKITYGKQKRRIDVIVDAPDLEQAQSKAIKQARHIFAPSKKATYSVMTIINESEALSATPPVTEAIPESPSQDSPIEES